MVNILVFYAVLLNNIQKKLKSQFRMEEVPTPLTSNNHFILNYSPLHLLRNNYKDFSFDF